MRKLQTHQKSVGSLVSHRSRSDPAVADSQLFRTRKVGSPPHARLSSNPRDGATSLNRRGCNNMGLNARSEFIRARLDSLTTTCQERRIFCMGCGKHNFQTSLVWMYALHEAVSSSRPHRVRGQYHLPHHVLDHQPFGFPHTDCINCGAVLRAFNAGKIWHHCCIQCTTVHLPHGPCWCKACRGLCHHRCVSYPLQAREQTLTIVDSLQYKSCSSVKTRVYRHKEGDE